MTYAVPHFVDFIQCFLLAMLVVGFAAKEVFGDSNESNQMGTFAAGMAIWIVATAIVIVATIAVIFGVIFGAVYGWSYLFN